jgi:hypothetical protein
MNKIVAAIFFFYASATYAQQERTQQSTVSAPDSFTLFTVPAAIGLVNINTNGLAVRSLAINPAIKTLVLITMANR